MSLPPVGVLLAGALFAVPMHTVHAATPYTDCRGRQIADAGSTLLLCPDTPNCVSSEHSDADARIESPTGITLAAVRHAIEAEPRSKIVASGDHWLIAHFRSRVFGFIDEAHFILREDGSLALRSGACTGYSDFGVNRRRLARIVAAAQSFALTPQDAPSRGQ